MLWFNSNSCRVLGLIGLIMSSPAFAAPTLTQFFVSPFPNCESLFQPRPPPAVINKLTCAECLSQVLYQNRFVATSIVVPILPYDSMFRSAKSKFEDVLTYIDLVSAARTENPHRVRMMVHVSGLNREAGDGGRFVDEVTAYGVDVGGLNTPLKGISYFLVLEGPIGLVLDVVGHPAVTAVTRVLKKD